MKKFLVIVAALLCICGCSKNSGVSLKDISYDQLNEKFTNKETFVLYIGSSSCSHCAEFKPILEKVISDYKLDVYYINMANVSDSEYQAVKNKTNLQGTPTVLLVKNGKSLTTNRIIGSKEYNDTVEFFKDIEYIK